jgi:hypothetical protein
MPWRSSPRQVGEGWLPLGSLQQPVGALVEAAAANLFFQLASSRYERACLIVTSNKPFGQGGVAGSRPPGRHSR